MILGPLPDCEKCQELVRALDEASELRKQKAIPTTTNYAAFSVAGVGPGDTVFADIPGYVGSPLHKALEAERQALRALAQHRHEHVTGRDG